MSVMRASNSSLICALGSTPGPDGSKSPTRQTPLRPVLCMLSTSVWVLVCPPSWFQDTYPKLPGGMGSVSLSQILYVQASGSFK